MKKVGIISSGYIDRDIVYLFLMNGYNVKVSTPDITKKNNYQHLMTLKHSENLYVSEMKRANHYELNLFSKDCDYIIFTDPSDFNFYTNENN